MTQINLLPWREQARQAKKQRFLITLGMFIGATLFFLLIWHLELDSSINYQQRRNDYLQTQLTQEKNELTSLENIKSEQAAINQQLNFIFSLCNDSFRVVRLLDELARVIPDAVSLNKIIRDADTVTILGKSESNQQVTLFMENMAKSHVFTQPVLTEITAKENSSGNERFFQLNVNLQK